MSGFFVIVNPYNDIIYSKPFNCTEKEYCTMYLIAYSCIDHFDELRKSEEDFFPCIEKHFCWNVTLYFLRNGMTFTFINSIDNTQDIIEFFENVEIEFSYIFLLPMYDFEDYIKHEDLETSIEKFYKSKLK